MLHEALHKEVYGPPADAAPVRLPTVYILLRREGWRVNHKRIYRLYGEEQLAVRTRRRKKRASHLRVVPPRPTRPNERWCMDFGRPAGGWPADAYPDGGGRLYA